MVSKPLLVNLILLWWHRHLLTTFPAAPLVSGLVAYFRGLPLQTNWATQLRNPRTVKALITHFHRHLDINDPGVKPNAQELQDIKPFIWNAQVFHRSCLLDRPFQGDEVCGDALPADLGTLSPDGGEPVQGNGNGNGHGSSGWRTITYQAGTPSPTCTTKCDTLCTGYYCQPNPTGKPPDFTDPVNRCAQKTTTTQCNGSGANTACAPVEVCADLPTLTGKPITTHTGSCLASDAVSTCAMGPGGQPACITTTTCTNWASAASSTTSSSTTAAPTPQNAFVVISLEELLVANDMGSDFVRQWDVFAAPLNKAVHQCTAQAIFTKSSVSGTSSDPGFPPSMGPFKAEGFTCNYKGNIHSLGSLQCDGVYYTMCQEFGKDAPGQDTSGVTRELCIPFLNPTITPVVVCRWWPTPRRG